MGEELRPFQRSVVAALRNDLFLIVAISLARGNGKSWLAGWAVARILDPADELFRAATESVLCAASIDQARIVFRFAREMLEPLGGYKFLDSASRISIVHVASNTRLRVISSSGKAAMGLVGTPYAICDEPGSWETVGGQLMWDALVTAQGKPNSPLRILVIGTLAPARFGWWHDLIADGTRGTTFVQALRGDPAKWSQASEIRRCNPLMWKFPESRARLLGERDEARRDSRLKGRFLSYRLNVPTGDESTMLLEVDDWKTCVCASGACMIVAIDLGGPRSWSAAVSITRKLCRGRRGCRARHPVRGRARASGSGAAGHVPSSCR